MQNRIAAARRNLSRAEAQGDYGRAAVCRAEIVRLSTPVSDPGPAAEITKSAKARSTKEA